MAEPEVSPQPSKSAAAKEAALNAAKKSLEVFKGLGGKFKGAGTNVGGAILESIKNALISIVTAPLLLFKGSLATKLVMLGFLLSIGIFLFQVLSFTNVLYIRTWVLAPKNPRLPLAAERDKV